MSASGTTEKVAAMCDYVPLRFKKVERCHTRHFAYLFSNVNWYGLHVLKYISLISDT